MWLRTPPKPVDALITLLMSLSIQGFIAVLKIALPTSQHSSSLASACPVPGLRLSSRLLRAQLPGLSALTPAPA